MSEAIVSGASQPSQMTWAEVADWYEAGTDLLKVRASYIFKKPRSYLWGVATWSKHVRPSYIRKFGTAEDVLAIPPPTNSWSTKPRTYGKRKRRTVFLTPKHTRKVRTPRPETASVPARRTSPRLASRRAETEAASAIPAVPETASELPFDDDSDSINTADLYDDIEDKQDTAGDEKDDDDVEADELIAAMDNSVLGAKLSEG